MSTNEVKEMVTKTELKEMYGNRDFTNSIIERFGDDETGHIIDLSQQLFGNTVYVSENEAKEMIQNATQQLCKDMLKIVGIEEPEVKGIGFSVESA